MTETMQTQSPELAQLKHLLLRDEYHKIQRLENLVEQHQSRVGDADAMRQSVAEIVTDALRDAERKQHRDLETAISPLVVGSIRSELRNSRDQMVEAFYPILGRLVSSYVASRFKRFVEALDEKIEHGLSGRLIRLRLKSLWMGIPYKALLVREARNFTILELSLIQRKSGLVVDHWRDPDEDMFDTEENNEKLFGGFVAALNEFAQDALQADDNELRSFETPDSRIYLRASSSHILAVRTRGRVNTAIEQALDKTLIEVVESELLNPRDAARESTAHKRISSRLPEVAEQLSDAVTGYKRTPVLGVAALSVIIMSGIGLGVWYYMDLNREAAAEHRVRDIVARQTELVGFPIDVDVSGENMVVSGLVPSQDVKVKLQDAITLVSGALDIDWKLASIGNEPFLDRLAEFEDMITRLATREAVQAVDAQRRADLQKVGQQITALRSQMATMADQTAVEALQTRFRDLLHDLNRLKSEFSIAMARLESESERFALSDELSLLSRKLKNLSDQLNHPNAQLISWMQNNAIFFSWNVEFRNPELVANQLNKLAGLLKESDLSLRIVGYTDPSGSDQRNKLIAAARAIKVEDALIERGIPEDRLKAIGRQAGRLLSADVGRASSNRRVEFEILYRHEPARVTGQPLLNPGSDPREIISGDP